MLRKQHTVNVCEFSLLRYLGLQGRHNNSVEKLRNGKLRDLYY